MVYVSPLKALAVDVERNLRSPLAGIANMARRMGVPFPGALRQRSHRRHISKGAARFPAPPGGHPDHDA